MRGDYQFVVLSQRLMKIHPARVSHLVVKDKKRLAGASLHQLNTGSRQFNYLFCPCLRGCGHDFIPPNIALYRRAVPSGLKDAISQRHERLILSADEPYSNLNERGCEGHVKSTKNIQPESIAR